MGKNKFRDFKRKVKFFIQRWIRGFDDSELWNLDCTIAQFILPRLRVFKEFNDGHPSNITMEEWNTILDTMIFSFENIEAEPNFDNELEYKIQHGLYLFAHYFGNLWL